LGTPNRQSIRFVPQSITNRAFWDAARSTPRHEKLREEIEKRSAEAPLRPPVPTASDYLAARTRNARDVVDNYWQRDRATLTALALRRCLLGIDPKDPDERLLDWIFSFVTHPTWTVSAHLPNHDLPQGDVPILDLASCEMAAIVAELREVLAPWIETHSQTLCATMLHEIDARILTPFANGAEVWWYKPDGGYASNWTGVCAGNILAACESLAAQGQPRPKAKTRALEALRYFFRKGFTPAGECDEGVMYWNYGMGMACVGLMRLAPDEFEREIERAGFEAAADYPRRAHLFGNTFFAGNDSGFTANAPTQFVPWLGHATGNAFLLDWAARFGVPYARDFTTALRSVSAPEAEPSPPEPASAKIRTQYLPDQQVAILRAPTKRGELICALSGGNNDERHNHNDLGHFIVALDGQIVIPDLGAPHYKTDFFGAKRYTYLTASSRGHNVFLVGEHEQRPGKESVSKVLSWQPDAEIPRLVLDLTAAYPPEAGLLNWTRTLECWPATEAAPPKMVLIDVCRLKEAHAKVTHVLWSLEDFREPDEKVEGTGFRMRLGPLNCEISPAPSAMGRSSFDPAEFLMRDFNGRTLHRIEAAYRADEEGLVKLETRFFPA